MKKEKEKKAPGFSMGGQALLEGVMMMGTEHYAVTVRRPDGQLQSDVFGHTSKTSESKFLNFPIVRGVIRFVESLSVGMKALDYSAEIFASSEEATTEEGAEAKEEQTETEDKKADKQTAGKVLDIFSYILGLALAIGLFVVLPVFLSRWLLKPYIQKTWLLSICEGLLRLVLFFAYILLISLMKDIRRTFEYHGAEHKTVACYEAGEELTVENARKHSRLNKRCGTSFIFIVMLIGILVFMFIRVENPVLRIAYRLLLLPLIAGISYEILKWSAKSDNWFVNLLVAPGLLFQKLTTKEPDDGELEVALQSARLILRAEGLPLPGEEAAAGETTEPASESAETAELPADEKGENA